MEFFNDNFADLVQFISLPLELMGLILVFIEVKLPNLADRIERQIDLYSDHVKEIPNLSDKELEKSEKKMHSAWGYLTSPVAILTFTTLFFGPLFLSNHLLKPVSHQGIRFVVVLIALGVSMLLMKFVFNFVFILVHKFFEGLNKFSNGNAIGTLGFGFAGLGALGEIYQVLVLLIVPKVV